MIIKQSLNNFVLMQPNSYKKNNHCLCDPTGWYWSTKYDGMKARWIDGKLTTRSGRPIQAPTWFLKLLPADANIEGELYYGKDTFYQTASLRSRSHGSEKTWDRVIFLVFDLIDYKLPWIERQYVLMDMGYEPIDPEGISKLLGRKTFLLKPDVGRSGSVKKLKQPIRLVKWYKVKSPEHVEIRYRQMINANEEGIILADPKGMYVDGHVNHLLKYKALKDCEAVIVDYRTDDVGNRLMSFKVHPFVGGRPQKKITFFIGGGLKTSDRLHFRDKYPIGTIIRYSYETMGKNGKPRAPVFQGIRADF